MKKDEMVYSPIEDKNLKNDLQNNPIWKNCFHKEEYEEAKDKYPRWFLYSIRFDDLKPIQLLKVSNI